MNLTQNQASAAVAIITSLNPAESILILRRAPHPNDPWSGHFSFPGGRKEIYDQDLLATCIRETKEETDITLLPEQVEKVLEPEPAGRNFNSPLMVQPFQFTLKATPKLILEKDEIVSSRWLDLEKFRDEKNHEKVEMIPGTLFPAFRMDDYYIWGFTYRLLKKIL